jgi:hypothetical protein
VQSSGFVKTNQVGESDYPINLAPSGRFVTSRASWHGGCCSVPPQAAEDALTAAGSGGPDPDVSYGLYSRLPDVGPALPVLVVDANGNGPHLRLDRYAGFDQDLTEPANPNDPKRMFTMLAQALKLAERTETLAQQNVELARETKELLLEVKDELKEVRDELRDVKEELREVKEDRAC